jgi:hypothetical protein
LSSCVDGRATVRTTVRTHTRPAQPHDPLTRLCIIVRPTHSQTVMKNSVYEIAHCGVDVSLPKMFTVIVGNKGEKSTFFCHIFKCESKEAASRVTVAVANACTKAFQEHKAGGGKPKAAPSAGAGRGSPAVRSPAAPGPAGAVSPEV